MSKKNIWRNRAILAELLEGKKIRNKANLLSRRSLARKFEMTQWEVRKAIMSEGGDPESDLIIECEQERLRLSDQLEPYSHKAIAGRYGVSKKVVENLANHMKDKEERQ